MQMLLELLPGLEKKNIGRYAKFEEEYGPDADII